MGLASGPLTYRRYRVLGEPPGDWREQYLQAMQDRAHREIDEESDETESFGWCVCGEPLNKRFTEHNLILGDDLIWSLRMDSRRVPSSIFSMYVRAAEQEYMRSTGKDKLGKRDREEIRSRLERLLRKRSLPQVNWYDCAWSIPSGVLRFWSQSKAVEEAFCALFQDTFGLKLVPRTVYTAMLDVGMTAPQMDLVLGVEPADLTFVAGRELELPKWT